MLDFAGWLMPMEYPSGVLAEHKAVRTSCGLFDVSHMGCLRVRGAGAVVLLNLILTNDLKKLQEGQVQYTLMCDESGGVIDDMLATRVAPEEILIVPNAANTARVVAELEALLPQGSLTDIGAETAIIAVQGPDSPKLIATLGLPSDHEYMSAVWANYRGREVLVSRTGYTGELGYELIVPGPTGRLIWDELIAAGAAPCGLSCRDTLRTEMGYALHGQDLTESITPLEAGLSWAVGWDKDEFGGAEALRKQREIGPDLRLRGLKLTGRGVLRAGMEVVQDGVVAGNTTSGTFSPTLQQGVGLALLRADVGLDEDVTVSVRGRMLAARTVRPPFVPSSVT
jgi:aminomethyltransferase